MVLHLGGCLTACRTAMERETDRSPDVERAAPRLARPHARARAGRQAAARRACWRWRCSSRCCRCSSLVLVLLAFARRRAGSSSACGSAGTAAASSLIALPRASRRRVRALLERIGARELPLLFAVLRGRLSFVGPRALPPGTGYGHTGPRRLMAPGLIGPAQRGLRARVARRRLRRALDAAGSTRCCSPGAARSFTTACRTAARRPRPATASSAGEQRRRRLTTGAAARHTNGTRKSQMRSVSAFVKPSDARRSRARRRSRSPRGAVQALQRQPGDRGAEDQQERRGGAEQPVPVRAPRRDPDRVDAARGAERADRVQAGGEREQRVEARAARRRSGTASLSAGLKPSRARTRIAAQAPTASSDQANSDADARATIAPSHGRLRQQRDRGEQAERQEDGVGARWRRSAASRGRTRRARPRSAPCGSSKSRLAEHVGERRAAARRRRCRTHASRVRGVEAEVVHDEQQPRRVAGAVHGQRRAPARRSGRARSAARSRTPPATAGTRSCPRRAGRRRTRRRKPACPAARRARTTPQHQRAARTARRRTRRACLQQRRDERHRARRSTGSRASSQHVRPRPVRADERRMRHAEQASRSRPAQSPTRDGRDRASTRASDDRRRVAACHARRVRRLAPLSPLALAGCGSRRRAPSCPRRPAPPRLAAARRATRRARRAGAPICRRSPRRGRSSSTAQRDRLDRSTAAARPRPAASRSPPRCSSAASGSRCCAAASGCSSSTTRRRSSGSGAAGAGIGPTALATDGVELLYVTDVAWRGAARLPPAPVRADPPRPSRRRTVRDRLRPRALGPVDRARRLEPARQLLGRQPARDPRDVPVDPRRARGLRRRRRVTVVSERERQVLRPRSR